jgi:hypothetical protein
MNVKAQGLLNAAKYVEERFGRDALGEVLRKCSPSVRETYTSSIAINWHPMVELCEFVEVADKHFGGPRGKLSQQIGAAGARANMKGTLLRIAFYFGRPEYMIKRAASLWRQFNDAGTMELLEMTDTIARIEVRGVPEPNVTFCHILTGWCREVSLALGVRNVDVTHPECLAARGQRCIYEVRGVFEKARGEGEGPPA